MRSFAFTDARANMAVVNPARATVIATRRMADGERPCRIELELADGAAGRTLVVAAFAHDDDAMAERLCRRIGEHLWDDDAPPLSESEQRCLDQHRAEPDTGDFRAHAETVPSHASRHPSLVAEFLGRSEAL